MIPSMAVAREDFKAGNYDAALAIAQYCLYRPTADDSVEPVEIWLLLAAIWHAKDFQFESELAYRQAARLLPDRVDIKLNLAHSLRRNHLLNEAEQIYREVVTHFPSNVHACLALMDFLSANLRYDEAIAEGERMLAGGAEHLVLRQAIGNAHFAAGHFDAALGVYQSALIFNPNHVDLLYASALAAIQINKSDQAEAFLLRVIGLEPDHLNALLKLAGLKKAVDDFESVIDYANRARQIAPDLLEPRQCLSDALIALKRTDAAIAVLDETWRAGCAVLSTFIDLGMLLRRTGDYDLARAVVVDGLVRYPHALPLLKLALNLRRDLCDWQSAPIEIPQQTASASDLNPVGITLENIWLANGSMTAKRLLRVGYVLNAVDQGDWGALLQGLLKRHDTKQVKVTVYVLGDAKDSVSGDLMDLGAVALVGCTTSQSVLRMRRDRIDVLVSLASALVEHQAIFAERIASIQCAWPGDFSDLGSSIVDYVLADPVVLPEDDLPNFSVRPIWMPSSCQYCDDGLEAAQIVPLRTVCGLPMHGFVFANFSAAQALDPESFGVWMRILRQVPGSVMWLGVDHPSTQHHLVLMAAQFGVKAERLVFAKPVSLSDQLARLRHADLYLVPQRDSMGYGLLAALWAGIPALACAGQNTLVSRFAQSALLAAEMADCVLPDLSALEVRAVDAALDPHVLHALRVRLSEQKRVAPLFDSDAFVKGFERALQTIWVNDEAEQARGPVIVQPSVAGGVEHE